VERRTHSLDDGFDRLARAGRDLDLTSGDAVADQLLAAMLPSDAVRADDVALLTVRVGPEASRPGGHGIDLQESAQSPALARGFVAGLLQGAGWEVAVDTATLLVSELVTNALHHGMAPCSLHVRFLPDELLEVAVEDGDAAIPTLEHPDQLSEHGRGMLLVDALATAWGIRPTAHGKQVWFTLSRPT
jgi:anti-sigma regulatory factor (Ser/Thr protein kinase)